MKKSYGQFVDKKFKNGFFNIGWSGSNGKLSTHLNFTIWGVYIWADLNNFDEFNGMNYWVMLSTRFGSLRFER